MKGYTFGKAEFFEQIVCHHEQIDVGIRLCAADNLSINLMELAVTPLLWSLIRKSGP